MTSRCGIAAAALLCVAAAGCERSQPSRERPRRAAARPSTVAAKPTRAATLTFALRGERFERAVALDGKTRELKSLSRARARQLVVALRDGIEFGPPKEVQPLWRLLRRGYDALLADASPELERAKSLTVRASGILRFVPFHALLRDMSGDGEKASFVVARWPVNYLPLGLEPAARPTPRRAFALVPRYGGERQPLKSGLAEAKEVRAGEARAELIEGATPQRMLKALSTSAALVHFAGHGLPNLERGGAPELIFGAERSLGVEALGAISVRASLVVLASCTTAYAARFRGARPLVVKRPLPELLLRRGAGAVIAASWGVKDAQSLAQMRSFYRHLARHGPAEALALAQRERIAKLSPPHPRYWAFYALYGAARFEGSMRK